MSASTVALRVFDTAELLEHILLETEVKTALRSQLVSRVFRNTIKGSTKLQRHLWHAHSYLADATPRLETSPWISARTKESYEGAHKVVRIMEMNYQLKGKASSREGMQIFRTTHGYGTVKLIVYLWLGKERVGAVWLMVDGSWTAGKVRNEIREIIRGRKDFAKLNTGGLVFLKSEQGLASKIMEMLKGGIGEGTDGLESMGDTWAGYREWRQAGLTTPCLGRSN